MINKLITFIKESIAEAKRVTWPTREAIIGGTVVVILVSLFLVVFMWIIDLIVTRFLALLMR